MPLLIALMLLWLPCSVVSAAPPELTQASEGLLTLPEAYALTLKRSETIAIQHEVIQEAEARFLQALSGILPTASFIMTDERQDGSGSSAFTLRKIPQRRFNVTQPLFSGFKEFAAMAASRAERRQRQAEQVRAEQLLLVDVANAFYLLAEAREDVATLERTRTTVLQRIEELKSREQLGRSRASEVASAEAQLRRIESDMEAARGTETTTRQLLEFLTGLPTVTGLTDAGTLPAPLASESAYLSKAVTRPDARAAEAEWVSAKRLVTVAQGALWPTVDLEGNYYTKRVGVAADVTWDALLTVDVPLFQGGAVVGAIREVSSQARQAQYRYEQAKREALLEAQNGYAELQSAVAQHAALERALQAGEEDYRLQTEDYRLSLVNNLDVLQALETLLNTRRQVIHAQYEVLRRYWTLQAAVGEGLEVRVRAGGT